MQIVEKVKKWIRESAKGGEVREPLPHLKRAGQATFMMISAKTDNKLYVWEGDMKERSKKVASECVNAFNIIYKTRGATVDAGLENYRPVTQDLKWHEWEVHNLRDDSIIYSGYDIIELCFMMRDACRDDTSEMHSHFNTKRRMEMLLDGETNWKIELENWADATYNNNKTARGC